MYNQQIIYFPFFNFYENRQFPQQLRYIPTILANINIIPEKKMIVSQDNLEISHLPNTPKNECKKKESALLNNKSRKQLQIEIQSESPPPRKTFKSVKKNEEENYQRSFKTKLVDQKEGRNANSNLLRMFFRRLQFNIETRPHFISSIINKYQLSITLQEFIQWIQTNKVDHRNYVRVPSIKKFFVDQQFVREHTKIMRVLLKDFLQREAVLCYLTSKKVRKQAMVHNYESTRCILREIFTDKTITSS